MKFIKKFSNLKIDWLKFYNEYTGLFFIMQNELFFARELNDRVGVPIEKCPDIVFFCGYCNDKLYFTIYQDPKGDERRFIEYDIESNNLKPLNFHINTEWKILGYTLINESTYLFSIKVESESRKILYNSLNKNWSWFKIPYNNSLTYQFEDTFFCFSNTSDFELVAYDLNSLNISWFISLAHLTSHIDHNGGPVKNPGRVYKFVMLFGDELILLTSNQLMISVDIKKHEIAWVSEPLLNYFPLNDFKFDYKEQRYYCIKEAKYSEEELLDKLNDCMAMHSYFFVPDAVVGDSSRGYVYLVNSDYLLEINLKMRTFVIKEIASLLPFPKIERLLTLYISKGLLYIAVSKNTAMPSVIAVYDPILEKLLFVHEIYDGIMNVLFFGDKFYLVGYDGHLYEFDRSTIEIA